MRDVAGNVSHQAPAIASPQEIASIMGGRWTSLPRHPICYIRDRVDCIEPGLENFLFSCAYFSRKGSTAARSELFSCVEAIRQGAVGCIVTELPRNLDPSFPCLIVDDVFEAITALSAHRRALAPGKFVAVTGSAGKTTTKNLIHALLSTDGPCNASIFNYNNYKSCTYFLLANLSKQHRYCVGEFGLAELSQQPAVFQPHIAVITGIEHEHINNMESEGYFGEQAIDRLVHFKTAFARSLPPGGYAILNRDNRYFDKALNAVRTNPNARTLTFGEHPSADVRLLKYELNGNESRAWVSVLGRELEYRLGIGGRHMLQNSLAAVGAAYAAGVSLERALPALASTKPGARRGEIHTVPFGSGFITLLDETVSSTLPGVYAMLTNLSRLTPGPGGRRIAILGELDGPGLSVVSLMAEVAAFAVATPIDRFYTIGEAMSHFHRQFPDRDRIAQHAQTLGQLKRLLESELQPGDLVALKSDRNPAGITLRRLVADMTSLKPPSGPAVNEPNDENLRIVVGGDIFFGEEHHSKRERHGKLNYLKTFGPAFSLAKLAPLTDRADCVLINLECTLTGRKLSPLTGKKDDLRAADPLPTVAALKRANVTAAMLGNDHAMDYGSSGLTETLEHLGAAGIAAFGAGADKVSAQEAFLKEFRVGGAVFKLAVISGHEFDSFHDEMKVYSGSARPGVNNINFDRLKLQIADLRARGYFVVVSPHWGENYCFRNLSQQVMARRMVNLGADLILGHGPGMLNEFEQINGVWVAYSLGNMVFNSESEYEARSLPPYSLLAEIELSPVVAGSTAKLNLYPIVSCNQMMQFQPTFVDDRQFQQVVGLVTSMQYDVNQFEALVATRSVDGRHCFTTKLF